MEIRLIASDVDGTILPRGGEISDRTRAAVHAAADRGVPFVIASGRWYVSALDVAAALKLARGYMIVSNGGAVVKMDGTPLKEWMLSRAQAEEIYGVLKRHNVMITAFVRNAVYRVNTQALGRALKQMTGDYFGGKYHLDSDNRAALEEKGLECPYKMEAYAGMDNIAELDAVREELGALGYSLSSAYADNVEIMAPGCGKGTAVRWLAEHLGFTAAECMAFGDNTNDLSMLETVGWPVAVGNAVEPLKAAAKIVAPDCDADGVAQIIERALRGEL